MIQMNHQHTAVVRLIEEAKSRLCTILSETRPMLAILILILIQGCSSAGLHQGAIRTGRAVYHAACDPLTWTMALGAATLYTTGADERITDYFMENHWIYEGLDKVMLGSNAVISYLSAAAVPEKSFGLKVKRILVSYGAFGLARASADWLEERSSHRSNEKGSYALGSNHAVEPFAGSAVTRRNTGAMHLSAWAKAGIVGVSYATASLAALTRVEQGEHSFADQLVNATVGNFIGIFLHDALMLEDSSLDVQFSSGRVQVNFSIPFQSITNSINDLLSIPRGLSRQAE